MNPTDRLIALIEKLFTHALEDTNNPPPHQAWPPEKVLAWLKPRQGDSDHARIGRIEETLSKLQRVPLDSGPYVHIDAFRAALHSQDARIGVLTEVLSELTDRVAKGLTLLTQHGEALRGDLNAETDALKLRLSELDQQMEAVDRSTARVHSEGGIGLILKQAPLAPFAAGDDPKDGT